MATIPVYVPSSPVQTVSLSYLWEDGSKAGFNNLTQGADSFVLNPRFEFSTDYRINAGGGNDTIATSAGDDVIYGGSGDDVISSGKGDDQLFGGSGIDRLFAGAGDDTLDGGSGDDLLDGSSGVDRLLGGSGNDALNGGADNDSLIGGAGADTLTGGQGRDVFSFALDGSVDVVTDFVRGQDSIVLSQAILRQLPDTHQGAYDVGAALFNANVPAGQGFTVSSGPFGYDPLLIFDAARQMLSFDADGLRGAGAAVDMVQLVGITQLSGADFYAPAPF